MMGSTTASCGHVLPDGFDGVMVWYKTSGCDAITGFYDAAAYACYCQPCADALAQTEEWLPDAEAAETWMDSRREPNPAAERFNAASDYLRDLANTLAPEEGREADVYRLHEIAEMLRR